LGAHSPEAYFFLAECTLRSGAGSQDAAERLIGQALKLSPDDPWILSLAGRIAFERGAYPLAVERLRAAIRRHPALIEAHNVLARAYAALGRKQEAEFEQDQVRTIQRHSSNEDPPYLSRLFQGSLLDENQ
jgi:predicted Zn-dependent protease